MLCPAPRQHAGVRYVIAEGDHLLGGDAAVGRGLRERGLLGDTGRRQLDERVAGEGRR
jgi:hypothetical protein